LSPGRPPRTLVQNLNRLTNLSTNHPASSRFIQSYGFTLGPAGNRTKIVEAQGLPQQRTLDYSYDALYRLRGESVTESLGLAYSKTFGYDPVGNRLTRTSTVASLSDQNFSFDTNNRLTTDTYDSNGNWLNSPGQTPNMYDIENRLTSAPAGGTWAAANTVSRGTSSCKRMAEVWPKTLSQPGRAEGTTWPLAPGTTTIWFSPPRATKMEAVPVERSNANAN
jgi:hypothetical protein